MSGHVGAPVSTALELREDVRAEDVTDSLRDWLESQYDVELERVRKSDLIVDWQSTTDGPFACRLSVSDLREGARRSVIVVSDEEGTLAIVEESPLAAVDGPHATVDLAEPTRQLLLHIAELTADPLGMNRHDLHDLEEVPGARLLECLSPDLAPGLVLAVTEQEGGNPSPVQVDLLARMRGLTLIGKASTSSQLFKELDVLEPRAGSVVSLARVSGGLETSQIGATALRRKPDSARRLLVRRQLSTPWPLDLERRRSAAMTHLLSGGQTSDLAAAMQLLEEESAKSNALSNRVKSLEVMLESAWEEQDEALSDLDDALSQVRYLQRAFRELGEVPLAEQQEDDDWHPANCVDAVIAARESLPFVVIGATDGHCQDLDKHGKRSIWGQKIWACLRALNDYCRAKSDGRFQGDISMYRDNPPDEAIPLLREYAPKESEPTKNDPKTYAARVFPVPDAVDESGSAYMEQHIKIDKGGHPAPRVHLYDDSGGPTQRIYVGYIGAHLPTPGGG